VTNVKSILDVLPAVEAAEAAKVHPEGAQLVVIARACRTCGAGLTLEEMHYYARGNGTATCNNCEGAWCERMNQWMAGNLGDIPPEA
jgi:hypothetical protein